MENATKALIISATVLIVLILIAVGLGVLNSTKEVSDAGDKSTSNLEANMFNSKFENYFGKNVSGSQTKSFISQVIVNNTNNPDYVVCICFKPKSGNNIDAHYIDDPSTNLNRLNSIVNAILNSNTYTIEINSSCNSFAKGYSNGYIRCINIIEN